jgi:hypothetical protein
MEVWYETGDITWQKPLSPEANERIQNLYDKLIRDQGQERDSEEGEA